MRGRGDGGERRSGGGRGVGGGRGREKGQRGGWEEECVGGEVGWGEAEFGEALCGGVWDGRFVGLVGGLWLG